MESRIVIHPRKASRRARTLENEVALWQGKKLFCFTTRDGDTQLHNDMPAGTPFSVNFTGLPLRHLRTRASFFPTSDSRCLSTK